MIALRSPRLLAAILAVTCFAPAARADDAAIATQLEAVGGTVARDKAGAVTQVSFKDCSKVGEAELGAIGQLAHLKNLTLYGKVQGLTDATVDRLTGLKELESLSTEGAQLSDDGLAKLAALKSLRAAAFFHLSFGRKGFTGTGFAAWASLPHLERLTVAGLSVGDEAFAAIAKITTLQEFSTWHTYQTAAGNSEIAKMPKLTKLKLGQRLPRYGTANAPPSLSDATIPTLASMKGLESLQIGEAHFTLAGLRGLKALPKLKQLTIYESDVAPAEIEQLRTEWPGVKIELQPLTEDQRKKLEQYLKP